MKELTQTAARHFGDILKHAMQYQQPAKALLIFDAQHEFTRALSDAFRQACPDAQAMDFDTVKPESVREAIFALNEGDLVVLIQTTNFRLNEFRLRLEIFNRKLKTIEISHLSRMTPDQYERYVDALSYDPDYIRPVGRALKAKVDACNDVIVRCNGTELRYEGGMESAKLNIGDYTGMKNTGGTFPIGEVFTEPKDLSRVNGEVMIFAFADMDHKVKEFAPFKVSIKNGILSVPGQAPEEFHQTLKMISEQEPVLVREFGLGLNRAMGKGRLVNDITAFERMSGLHLSLGAKHAIYQKPGLPRKKMRYHVDVFADMQEIIVDGQPIYKDGKYVV